VRGGLIYGSLVIQVAVQFIVHPLARLLVPVSQGTKQFRHIVGCPIGMLKVVPVYVVQTFQHVLLRFQQLQWATNVDIAVRR
jgi:hypothetical protein